MNTKQLRQKILDLAIRGKLVPQDPNDEPASVLLERIRAEKEKLINSGKIKRDKRDSVIVHGDDKSHYGQLPQGWIWSQLSQIAIFSGGKTPSTDNNTFWHGSFNWTTSKDVKCKYIDSTITKLSKLGTEQMRVFPPKTLVMVVRSGILRRTLPIAILRQKSTVNQDIKTMSFFIDDICEFVYFYFLAKEENILTQYAKSGTTVESINFDEFKDIRIPLPPLSEQYRITSSIDTIFSLITEIEDKKADLKEAIAYTKSKILSLAVSGKLVPQNQDDEPAYALLERIRLEQNKLAKAGQIKRMKGENAIFRGVDNSYYENVAYKKVCIDEQIPFNLPKTWEWYRLSNLWDLLSGRDLAASEYSATKIGIPYITGASNFTDNDFIINRWTLSPKTIAKNGDLLITCKGTVGAMKINTQGEVHIARQIMAVRNRSGLNVEFLIIAMTSFIIQITSAAKGIIPGISREDLLNMLIPCPPINEQKMIAQVVSQADANLLKIADNLN